MLGVSYLRISTPTIPDTRNLGGGSFLAKRDGKPPVYPLYQFLTLFQLIKSRGGGRSVHKTGRYSSPSSLYTIIHQYIINTSTYQS